MLHVFLSLWRSPLYNDHFQLSLKVAIVERFDCITSWSQWRRLKPMIHGLTFVEHWNVVAAVQQMLTVYHAGDVERWNLPFNMLKVVERCWTKIELGSIPFNKLPAVERLKPIVFRVWCHVVSWQYQHGGRRVGISWVRVRMEFW